MYKRLFVLLISSSVIHCMEQKSKKELVSYIITPEEYANNSEDIHAITQKYDALANPDIFWIICEYANTSAFHTITWVQWTSGPFGRVPRAISWSHRRDELLSLTKKYSISTPECNQNELCTSPLYLTKEIPIPDNDNSPTSEPVELKAHFVQTGPLLYGIAQTKPRKKGNTCSWLSSCFCKKKEKVD